MGKDKPIPTKMDKNNTAWNWEYAIIRWRTMLAPRWFIEVSHHP